MKLRIEKALKQGVAAHVQVSFTKRAFLWAILQSEPRHPEANHNLYVAVSVNKCHEALPLLRALESNPNKSSLGKFIVCH